MFGIHKRGIAFVASRIPFGLALQRSSSHQLKMPAYAVEPHMHDTITVLWLCAITPLAGCDLCALQDAPAIASGPSTVKIAESSGLSVGLFEQWTHFGTLKDGGHTIDNEADQHLDSSVSQ